MRRLLALAFVLLAVPASAQIQPSGFARGVTPPIFGLPVSAVNGGGSVTTPQLLLPDGSAAAPALAFVSEPSLGLYRAGAGAMNFASQGATTLQVTDTTAVLKTAATLQWGSTGGVGSPDVSLSRGAANVLTLASGDMLSFGGVTSSQPMLKASGADIEVRVADDSARGNIFVAIANASSQYNLNGVRTMSATAPTVTSAGTSPSITTNGTVAGRINVGTGGTATTIVLAMPTATTGWNCTANNITAAAANRANQAVKQQSSTTTAATIQNQTVSTGAALAFTASDIVSYICFAY